LSKLKAYARKFIRTSQTNTQHIIELTLAGILTYSILDAKIWLSELALNDPDANFRIVIQNQFTAAGQRQIYTALSPLRLVAASHQNQCASQTYHISNGIR
jgi:hypothetical protein